MFWFKFVNPYPSRLERGFLLFALLVITTIVSCRPDVKESAGKMKYFDLKGYFLSDSSRLTQRNPVITKTAIHNGASETRKVKISNWGSELEPFITSDINKPAWRESYSIKTGQNITVYTAKLPELKTRQVIIKQTGGKLNWIQIYNHTKNMLYEDDEKLIWFPDSVYTIAKAQKVRLLSREVYYIKGEFN